MATKPVLSEHLEVCTVQYKVNSGFSEILELKPVQEFHQALGCVCGPAIELDDISTCAESLLVFA